MKKLILAAGAIATMTTISAKATLYDVDQSFTDPTGASAELKGTVQVVPGSYMIENGAFYTYNNSTVGSAAISSPFTVVNLTLTVNNTPYVLDTLVLSLVGSSPGSGARSGEFVVNATSTGLFFSTPVASANSPADLVLSEGAFDNVLDSNCYVIGSNGNPNYEAAYTGAGWIAEQKAYVSPIEFGIVSVPEPPTYVAASLCFGLVVVNCLRRRGAGVKTIADSDLA